MTDFATDQSILDFYQEPECNGMMPVKQVPNKKIETAHKMALDNGKPMVVVDMGNGAYEIYPKSVAVKWEKEWEYDTEEVNN